MKKMFIVLASALLVGSGLYSMEQKPGTTAAANAAPTIEIVAPALQPASSETSSESGSFIVHPDSDKGSDKSVDSETVSKSPQKIFFDIIRECDSDKTEQIVAKLNQLEEQIAAGADVKWVDEFGQTPLHVAAKMGKKQVVDWLIAKGADVNAVDKDGNTPLIVTVTAASKLLVVVTNTTIFIHYRNVVESLIKAGADVNKAGKDGKTPQSVVTSKVGKGMLNGYKGFRQPIAHNKEIKETYEGMCNAIVGLLEEQSGDAQTRTLYSKVFEEAVAKARELGTGACRLGRAAGQHVYDSLGVYSMAVLAGLVFALELHGDQLFPIGYATATLIPGAIAVGPEIARLVVRGASKLFAATEPKPVVAIEPVVPTPVVATEPTPVEETAQRFRYLAKTIYSDSKKGLWTC